MRVLLAVVCAALQLAAASFVPPGTGQAPRLGRNPRRVKVRIRQVPKSNSAAVLHLGGAEFEVVASRNETPGLVVPKECQPAEAPVLIVKDDDPELAEMRNKALCMPLESYGLRPPDCRMVVGLASVEGSGNHFARHLLEQVTGIITGSKFGDAAHWKRLGVQLTRSMPKLDEQGQTLAIKTHLRPGHQSHGSALGRGIRRRARVVYIVRDPRGAILANYQRLYAYLPMAYFTTSSNRVRREMKRKAVSAAAGINAVRSSSVNTRTANSHTSVVQDWDTPSRMAHFRSYIAHAIRGWVGNVRAWTTTTEWKPILVVRYEDMKHNTREVLMEKLLPFVGIDPATIPAERIECVLRNRNSTARVSGTTPAQIWADSRLNSIVLRRAGKLMAQHGYGAQYDP
mmetsp:Transcript_46903/g.119643  ORF Transcript_46903/g.119643 Transcript_46903/m.119643 type:complete len:399 (+) Transcript_46903:97-1293(+)